MKKMMMMAMVGLMALCGTAENACTPAETVIEEPTLVYTVKMTVNTPKGISKFVKGSVGSVCNPGDATDDATTVIRATDKTHIKGYIYDCTATCDTVATGSIVLWDADRKVQLDNAALATELIHVIGKKRTEAEWLTGLTGTVNYDASRTADYDLKLGAFGKFSTKKGFYESFSGTFAGTVSNVYDLTPESAGACEPAGYCLCSDLTTIVVDEPAVAYGSFSVKYSKSASKKFAKNGYLKVPGYVTLGE